MEKTKHSLTKLERKFIETVWAYYIEHGRHDLPWRKTTDPYKILVSEIMLQQTQVSRVLPKYQEFLKTFPNTKKLAEAPLGDVLRVWQGLGYNRRAKFLKLAAEAVVSDHKGKWPKSFYELKALPGIGSYTAAAVMNFAYNEPTLLIETNVRTVYLHHFFHNKHGVPDSDLSPIIERTLDTVRPREWHWALMDYGSHLKATIGNTNVRSKSYKKQSNFKGSDRQIRGAIIRELSKQTLNKQKLRAGLLGIESKRFEKQLISLQKENLIVKRASKYQLP